MLKLSPAQRSALRSEAHGISPIVLIGEAGLTPAVMKEIDGGLNAHGLIKVRVFGDDREQRIQFYQAICEELRAAPIQHIGKLLVLYRPKAETEKERSTTRGKGMREVTIVKPSGIRKPTVTKVMVKGNERVTFGGNIKRAKTRQTSKKKRALGE
jgi:RNA-binding protein